MNILNTLRSHIKKEESIKIESSIPENSVMTLKPDYYDYIEYMERLGWKKKVFTLTEKTQLVNIHSLNRETYGAFINIRCPARCKMTFPGLNQFNINKEHFSEYPNLYEYPYSLSIECTNDENEEMLPDRLVKITKEKESGIINLTTERYANLNIKADNRIKRLEERYYLNQGVELNGEEHMLFCTQPDIEITNIELFTKVDLWIT